MLGRCCSRHSGDGRRRRDNELDGELWLDEHRASARAAAPSRMPGRGWNSCGSRCTSERRWTARLQRIQLGAGHVGPGRHAIGRGGLSRGLGACRDGGRDRSRRNSRRCRHSRELLRAAGRCPHGRACSRGGRLSRGIRRDRCPCAATGRRFGEDGPSLHEDRPRTVPAWRTRPPAGTSAGRSTTSARSATGSSDGRSTARRGHAFRSGCATESVLGAPDNRSSRSRTPDSAGGRPRRRGQLERGCRALSPVDLGVQPSRIDRYPQDGR